MKNLFIFAVSLMGINSTASASQVSNSNEGIAHNTKVKTTVLLANGTEKEFVSYVEASQKKNVNSIAWSDFIEVLASYNQNPKEFLKLDDSKKTNFNVISLLVQKDLVKSNTAEAKQWNNSLRLTIGVINYLWNSNTTTDVSPTNIENVADHVESL
jgi:hypothetical protein